MKYVEDQQTITTSDIILVGEVHSSAYSAIDRERPYAATVFVCEEECVNHVIKRMETNL